MKITFFYSSLLLLLLNCLCGSQVLSQNFEVQGTKILDPDGKEFIIKGINVNGPHWPWNRPTVPDADLMTKVWKFNTVRINFFPSLATNGCCRNNNTNTDEIITTFTSRKVVAILENHDFTGKYPNDTELENLKNWWTDLANKYKNNTYVWFNIMNEPGGGGVAPERWKETHEAVVKAIRATGADNIIVLDGHQFGQESGYKDPKNSAILTFGQYFVQNYKNITFSLHLYSEWIYGQERLTRYIDDVLAKGLSIHLGEYGTADNYSKAVAVDIFKVAPPKKIGRIAWQWTGVDAHKLTQNSGAWAINKTDGSKPTNLSFVGNLIWKDNHEQAFTNEDFALSAPWLSNGGFESNLDEWINFGGAEVENSPPHLVRGQKSVRINSGSASGCGQPIYLQPDTEYVFTAWGKNSRTPTTSSDIAVRYKTPTGAETVQALNFTETSFTQKKREFRTPTQLVEAFLFIYKNDPNVIFYADEIQLLTASEASQVTSSEEERFAQFFQAFPNPATDMLRIKHSLHSPSIEQVYLMDSVGKIIYPSIEKTDQQEINIRLDQVGKGAYILLIRTDKAVFRKKVILQ
jgi:hypothetical protein